MKKLFFLLAASAALFMFTGCDPDNVEGNSAGGLKSYEEAFMMDGAVHFKYVFTPIFGVNGIIATLKYEHYEEDRNWETGETNGLYLAEKGTTKYTWSNLACNGVFTSEYYDSFEDKWEEGTPTNYQLVFNDNWTLGEYTYSTGSYSYKTNYEYDGDYLKSAKGTIDYTYTWKDGDLVSVSSENLTFTITYTTEANTLADGIDPLLQSFMDGPYTLGLMGKHSAHLPAKIGTLSGSGEYQNRELQVIEYKKDGQGRVIEAKLLRADPETGKPFEDMSHANVFTFNY